MVPGDSLKYGEKELKFLGLIQQESLSQDHGIDKKSGKFKEMDNEVAPSFEFSDHSQNLTQKFVMSPRYYQSNETQGDGDGLYEFRPLMMQSQSYSEYKYIEMSTGKFSG